MLIRVVLPEPEGPTKDTNSPFSMVSETPSTAGDLLGAAVIDPPEVLGLDRKPAGRAHDSSSLRMVSRGRMRPAFQDG